MQSTTSKANHIKSLLQLLLNFTKTRKKMKLSKKTWAKIGYAIAAAIMAFLTAMGFSSCGITRATISRPAEGTQTTVTITTNNPMTTTINPSTNAEVNTNKK